MTTISTKAARQRFDLSPIIKRFGAWAVTEYGMECLIAYYPIEANRLWLNEPAHGWADHMRNRRYPTGIEEYGNFCLCLEAAKQYHKKDNPERKMKARERRLKASNTPISPRDRFTILKRDDYRCKICGSTAGDGIKLHVDHKVPKAKGGSSEHSNLWTTCNHCNLGKGTLDL